MTLNRRPSLSEIHRKRRHLLFFVFSPLYRRSQNKRSVTIRVRHEENRHPLRVENHRVKPLVNIVGGRDALEEEAIIILDDLL